MGKILKKKSDVEEITQHANKKKESTPWPPKERKKEVN